MKTIEVVAAIIVREEPELKIFTAQRGYGELIGKWEFPGGKIESNESKEQAIIREIREELEIKIKIKDYLTTVDYDYPKFHLTMHCFICVAQKNIASNEHQALKWCTIAELDELDWCPADTEVVKSLKNYLAKKS